MIVTLGKYDSEKEAEADCERFVKEGYADVRVDPFKPPPAPKDAK